MIIVKGYIVQVKMFMGTGGVTQVEIRTCVLCVLLLTVEHRLQLLFVRTRCTTSCISVITSDYHLLMHSEYN